MITIEPVDCGIDSTTGLEKKRLFQKFIGDMSRNLITVYYQEFLVTETGARVNVINKTYTVKDEAPIYDENNEMSYSGSTAFTGWYNQLGSTVIIPAINARLSIL